MLMPSTTSLLVRSRLLEYAEIISFRQRSSQAPRCGWSGSIVTAACRIIAFQEFSSPLVSPGVSSVPLRFFQ